MTEIVPVELVRAKLEAVRAEIHVLQVKEATLVDLLHFMAPKPAPAVVAQMNGDPIPVGSDGTDGA